MIDIFYTYNKVSSDDFIRTILARYYNIPNATICKSINGKPYIEGRKIHFNLTHSKGLTALAGPIGAHVNLIPVNSAESILSPFWDAGLSDFKQWEIQCADGSAVQKWDVHLHWKGKSRLIRKMDLDVSRFDTIIPALSLLPGVKVKVEAVSDKGKRSAEYTVPDDQGKTTEFPLALNGATRLSEFSVTLESPKKTFGFFKYLLISDSKRLKDVERQYADLGKMDFSKFPKY